jgi:hypothetical protein
MNRYLSKPEKVSLTRIMLLVDVLDQVIADYQKAKGVDAESLKYLRTCRTWGTKALKRRYDFLDLDAAKDFTRHIHHMDIIFVPNDKAQKYYKIVQDMAGSICLTADDFEKLYSGFIPKTCAKCHKKAWKKCLIREVFRKYGVEVVNTKATNCPYSYLEAGINLEEWARQWALMNNVEYDKENMWESDGEVHGDLAEKDVI